MKIAIIGAVYGVTGVGRITADLTKALRAEGHTVLPIYGRGPVPEELCGDGFSIEDKAGMAWHGLMTRAFDLHGLCSRRATRKLIRKLDEFRPDWLWLQNIHGYYLNYPLLFRWIKAQPRLRVRWTLHDCWSFTGHCAHFSACGCERWMSECHDCPLKATYPGSMLADGSRRNYRMKKDCFTKVPNLTLQVPSEWLAKLVRKSFLGAYPIEVVPNPINTEVFHPTESDFRKRYRLENCLMVLAVGTNWKNNKGLPDYIKLSKLLPEDIRLVLVGIPENEAKLFPSSVLCLPRTDRSEELAAIYTAADVLISASREEVFGMTIAEAHACGTPAIVYEGTACEEVAKACGGMAVPMKAEALCEAICRMKEKQRP